MPLTLVVHCDYITYLYRPRVFTYLGLMELA